ncbi:unnamed protein product [Urochloa humidicola]
MATDLLSKVSIAVAAYARRFTRRLRRARRLRRGGTACLGGGGGGDRHDGGQEQAGGGGVWRRAILMGRRCEPLDFPGAIHYDSFGRRVESPRCGSRKASPPAVLFCRSSDAVDEAVTAAATKKAN